LLIEDKREDLEAAIQQVLSRPTETAALQ